MNQPDRIEHLNIDDLIPYARNARTHSHEQVAQIAASIREFGFTNPVLIDATGGIIAGHGRVLGARQLGLATVPCIRLGYLSEAQKRAYILADNQLALNGGWDEELLALELRDLKDMDYELALTGFELDDIDELLAGLEATPEGQTDADAPWRQEGSQPPLYYALAALAAAPIDDANWRDYLTSDGVPSSRVIVEGANLFLTPHARVELSKRGALIVKDSSANKCGVICSSYEIQAGMLLSDEAFLKIKSTYVQEVLDRLRSLARAEAELLMSERRRHPTLPLAEVSARISKAINGTADTIHASMAQWTQEDRLLSRTLVVEHLPPVLVRTVGERLWSDLPGAYVEWLIAKRLASTIVYREGVDFMNGMDPEATAVTALQYLRREQETRRLVAALRSGGLQDADREAVARLLERSGTRGSLLDG